MRNGDERLRLSVRHVLNYTETLICTSLAYQDRLEWMHSRFGVAYIWLCMSDDCREMKTGGSFRGFD
jgi:hypothetical protein